MGATSITGGGASASQSKIDSNFASVGQQSGIKAGDGGFNVAVNNNTDLKGAVIASTQAVVDNNKNTFATGSRLTTSDIQNTASFNGSAAGVSMDAGTQAGKFGVSGVGVGVGSDKGSAGSTTTAGISGIAGNTAVRSTDTEAGLKKIFDAAKVQREIDAQVQITQSFGKEASKAVGDYAQGQRKVLQEQLKIASTETEKQALQTQINDTNLQERVLNVLVGAVTGFGGAALAKESLSAGADQMRQSMIEDSKKFAGVTDGTTLLSNTSRPSAGVRGDDAKVGGTRVDLDLLCGTTNERCAVQKNPDGTTVFDGNGVPKLYLNDQGQVQFDAKDDKGKSIPLADYLKTPEGNKLSGPTGGIQGAIGTLFGVPYQAGSWQDKLIEAFSGTHDMIGGKARGLYNEQGNIKRGMTATERKVYDNMVTTSAIVPSLPFTLAELLSPDVWKAISILLKGAR